MLFNTAYDVLQGFIYLKLICTGCRCKLCCLAGIIQCEMSKMERIQARQSLPLRLCSWYCSQVPAESAMEMVVRLALGIASHTLVRMRPEGS